MSTTPSLSSVARVLLAIAMALSWCTPTRADPVQNQGDTSSSDGGTELTEAQRKVHAKQNYQLGLNLYAAGDLAQSLAAFERAYALIPHYAVLFNIGQIRGKLGHPVEAVQALRQFIEQGANKIDSRLRREAELAIESNARRIGGVRIAVEPTDATVLIDGARWNSETSHMPLAVGPHVLIVMREGYVPKTERFEVLGETLQSMDLKLDAVARASRSNGWLWARCSVPGSTIFIDDQPAVRMNTSAHFAVEAGARRIRFERPGYSMAAFEVLVGEEAIATADCKLEPLANLSHEQRATLRVSAPADLRVTIDERPFRAGVLPVGPHHLKAVRGPKVVWEQEIDLASGEHRTISPRVLPLGAEHSLAPPSAGRRTLAYIMGGLGLASLTGGAVALAIGSHRYSEWEKERDALAADPSATSSWSQAVTHAAEIQRLEGIGVGLGIAGVSLIAASVYVLVTDASAATTTEFAVSARRGTIAQTWRY